jgi:nicotinamide mononucleotide transporter
MPDLLSVDTVFVTVLGYPLSYIEFVGTVLYLASVWLIVKRNILTWPVGIVSVVLFAILFYQIRLYSDTIEQVYYLAASVYGWWFWSHTEPNLKIIEKVGFSPHRSLVGWAAFTIGASLVVGLVMTRIHLWLPAIFGEPASYPYVDGLTTVMSFVAMWLLARKRVESWVYWIVVDVIGIWLYFVKDVKFLSLLYVILLVIATKGFLEWRARRID